MISNKLNIGLFGLGCVGQGLYHVLNNSTGFKADIVKIAVKHKDKERFVPNQLITYNKWDILGNPDINVVVELIDDADEAYHIVSEALRRGKHVVTANKKMLAKHLSELYALQRKHQVSLLYEAAACGSIPIIRSLEEYFDNEDLEFVSGIFNGTTNYILTKTIQDKLSYANALTLAQEKGFAESDPTNDVEGFDPKFKAVIIAFHAFGLILPEEEVLNIGITGLKDDDIRYAAEKGYKIKLTPIIKRLGNDQVTVFVLPQFIKQNSQLFNVDNEFNGVVVEGQFSGEQFLQGRGAGSLPTGAAVLSDVSALSYGYRYEYKKHTQKHATTYNSDVLLNIYLRYDHEDDLKLFDFETVDQQYTSGGYNYVVGKINLQQIIKNRTFIVQNRLFISLVNDAVTIPDLKVSVKEGPAELVLE